MSIPSSDCVQGAEVLMLVDDQGKVMGTAKGLLTEGVSFPVVVPGIPGGVLLVMAGKVTRVLDLDGRHLVMAGDTYAVTLDPNPQA